MVRKQRAHIFIRFPRWVVCCRLICCRLLVAILEWLRVLLDIGPRPQISQILAIVEDKVLILYNKPTLIFYHRQGK